MVERVTMLVGGHTSDTDIFINVVNDKYSCRHVCNHRLSQVGIVVSRSKLSSQTRESLNCGLKSRTYQYIRWNVIKKNTCHKHLTSISVYTHTHTHSHQYEKTQKCKCWHTTQTHSKTEGLNFFLSIYSYLYTYLFQF